MPKTNTCETCPNTPACLEAAAMIVATWFHLNVNAAVSVLAADRGDLAPVVIDWPTLRATHAARRVA